MPRDDLTPVWKALADPTRRRTLDLLRERPRTTGELSGFFDLSRFAVMKHLTVLEAAGLVVVRRSGRERWNHLNAVPLQRIHERWMSPYESHWAASLLRLERRAEQAEGGADMPGTPAVSTIEVGSFAIEQEVTIEAPPARVFEALTKEVSAWWGRPYFARPEAVKDLVLEAWPGGRLYERWSDGEEGALWATVKFVRPPEVLELVGSIGVPGAVHGFISFELRPVAGGTRLKLSHRAIGEVTQDMGAAYAGGWSDLLGTRLKAYAETGTRYGIGHEPPPGGAPGPHA